MEQRWFNDWLSVQAVGYWTSNKHSSPTTSPRVRSARIIIIHSNTKEVFLCQSFIFLLICVVFAMLFWNVLLYLFKNIPLGLLSYNRNVFWENRIERPAVPTSHCTWTLMNWTAASKLTFLFVLNIERTLPLCSLLLYNNNKNCFTVCLTSTLTNVNTYLLLQSLHVIQGSVAFIQKK